MYFRLNGPVSQFDQFFIDAYGARHERADVPVEVMDDLSATRVNSATRAFIHNGMDYGVRSAPGRGYK